MLESELAPIQQIIPEGERPQLNWVGAIYYNDDKNLLALGIDEKSNLGAARVDLSQKPIELNRTSGRVLELNEYENIDLAQIDMFPDVVELVSDPTLRRSKNSLIAKIKARNIDTQEDGTLGIEETSLLRILTHEQGGIITFWDNEGEDQNGLVIEREYQGHKQAMILLFKPSGQTGWVDSSKGTSDFFRRLLGEYERLGLVEQSLINAFANLDHNLAKKRITESSSRINFYKAYVLGLKRLHNLTQDEKYLDLFRQSLNLLNPKGLFTRGRINPQDFQQTVSTVVSSAFIERDPDKRVLMLEDETSKVAPSEDTEDFAGIKLKTKQAQEIYQATYKALGDKKRFGLKRYDDSLAAAIMGQHFRKVIEFTRQVSTIEDIDDAQAMVEHLRKTPFSDDSKVSAKSGLMGDQILDFQNYPGDLHYWVSRILHEALKFLHRKRLEKVKTENIIGDATEKTEE